MLPCQVDGNTTSTIQYKNGARQKQAFKFALGCSRPMVKALHHTGAVMFMRSTTGCGTLAGPSLELEAFLSKTKERIHRQSRSEISLRAWNTRKARKIAAEEI